MKTHAELARESLDDMMHAIGAWADWCPFRDGDEDLLTKDGERMVRIITAALDAAYKRGAEEMQVRAAKVLDEDLHKVASSISHRAVCTPCRYGVQHAALIRALPAVEEK